MYQPDLPKADSAYGQFYLLGGYGKAWRFLGLDAAAAGSVTLDDVAREARVACALSKRELHARNKKRGSGLKDDDLDELCFRSSYAYALLRHGHGFDAAHHRFTAAETLRSPAGVELTADWALGAILYEINSLPWTLARSTKPALEQERGADALGASCLGLAVGFAADRRGGRGPAMRRTRRCRAPTETRPLLSVKYTTIASVA